MKGQEIRNMQDKAACQLIKYKKWHLQNQKGIVPKRYDLIKGILNHLKSLSGLHATGCKFSSLAHIKIVTNGQSKMQKVQNYMTLIEAMKILIKMSNAGH